MKTKETALGCRKNSVLGTLVVLVKIQISFTEDDACRASYGVIPRAAPGEESVCYQLELLDAKMGFFDAEDFCKYTKGGALPSPLKGLADMYNMAAMAASLKKERHNIADIWVAAYAADGTFEVGSPDPDYEYAWIKCAVFNVELKLLKLIECSEEVHVACQYFIPPASEKWNEWSECDSLCASGKRVRTFDCGIGEKTEASGRCRIFSNSFEVLPCNGSSCPVDGGWSDYKLISDCSTTCGHGVAVERRYCNNPRPSNGGKDCVGNAARFRNCTFQEGCVSNTAMTEDHRIFGNVFTKDYTAMGTGIALGIFVVILTIAVYLFKRFVVTSQRQIVIENSCDSLQYESGHQLQPMDISLSDIQPVHRRATIETLQGDARSSSFVDVCEKTSEQQGLVFNPYESQTSALCEEAVTKDEENDDDKDDIVIAYLPSLVAPLSCISGTIASVFLPFHRPIKAKELDNALMIFMDNPRSEEKTDQNLILTLDFPENKPGVKMVTSSLTNSKKKSSQATTKSVTIDSVRHFVKKVSEPQLFLPKEDENEIDEEDDDELSGLGD